MRSAISTTLPPPLPRAACAALLLAALALLFAALAPAAAAPARKPADNAYVPEEPELALERRMRDASELTPQAVPGFVAPLSDTAARALLIEQLGAAAQQRQAQQAGAEERGGGLIQSLQDRALEISERFDASAAALARLPATADLLFNNLTDLRGWPALRHGLLALAAMLAAGWLARWWLARLCARQLAALFDGAGGGWRARLAYLALRLLGDLLGIALFTLVAWGLSFAFFARFDPMRLFATAYLSLVVALWLAWMLSRFVLSPQAGGGRLLRLDDAEAASLHRWWLWLAGIAAGGYFTHGLLVILGLPEALQRLFAIAVGSLLVALLLVLLWRKRGALAARIGDVTGDAPTQRLRRALAPVWHLLAGGYLLGLWALWSIDVLLAWQAQARAAVYSLLVVLALPLADRLFALLLAPWFDSAGGGPSAHMYTALRRSLRGLLLLAALVLLIGAWWPAFYALLDTPAGQSVSRAVLNFGATALLAWLAWQAIRCYVDPQLRRDATAAGEAPASRAQTLLPLLRSVVLAVLGSVLVMVGLSSLGVDIGPLLAGAGVVGLAIGFGAQKLVQDVLAGLFFLIEDAFRVGEQIVAGEARGTVESISLRSMQLRDSGGALHTVTFGDLAAVRNLSRE